jgi:hypothetical protein
VLAEHLTLHALSEGLVLSVSSTGRHFSCVTDADVRARACSYGVRLLLLRSTGLCVAMAATLGRQRRGYLLRGGHAIVDEATSAATVTR